MKRVVVIVAIIATFVLVCCGGAVALMLGGLNSDPNALTAAIKGCGTGSGINPNGRLPNVSGLSQEQVRNAAIIIQVGQEMKVSPRGWVVALATALQESNLVNLGDLGPNNDHDSLGLFQQRPSQGWGTPQQVMDPKYAARKFYEKLVKISGWEKMRLTDAAQMVQGSAFPDAYQKWESLAALTVNTLTGGAGKAAADAAAAADLQCAAPGQISAAGWVRPTSGPVGSGFRTAERPDHYGVDISSPRGEQIHAASSGIVLVSECNASTSNCDVDGSPSVIGCGWYVDIRHAGNVVTRYCHMVSRPLVRPGQQVTVGQVLGQVGSSGNSSGPHLHFEVHVNGDQDNSGARDPIPFMSQHGAPLG